MSSESKRPTLWGVFVGNHGDQLEILNSKNGPFPPPEGSEGFIAIGWPAIGCMSIYLDKQNKPNYLDFVAKFRLAYPPDTQKHSDQAERILKTQANMPWYFAFEMAIGDWVISPCNVCNLVFIGVITGDYESDFHDELGFLGQKRVDFVHFRKVCWKYIITKSDSRFKKLNRIGQLTVSRQHMSFDEFQNILMCR